MITQIPEARNKGRKRSVPERERENCTVSIHPASFSRKLYSNSSMKGKLQRHSEQGCHFVSEAVQHWSIRTPWCTHTGLSQHVSPSLSLRIPLSFALTIWHLCLYVCILFFFFKVFVSNMHFSVTPALIFTLSFTQCSVSRCHWSPQVAEIKWLDYHDNMREGSWRYFWGHAVCVNKLHDSDESSREAGPVCEPLPSSCWSSMHVCMFTC